MNIRTHLLLSTLLMTPAAALSHDFIRPDGSTLSGEIAGVASIRGVESVLIKTTDQRQLTVPLSALTQRDMDHFFQWATQNQKYAFGISGLDGRQGSQNKNAGLRNRQGQALDGHTQDKVYTITLTNKSAFTTPELSVETGVWIDPTGRSSASLAKTATIQIPALKPGGAYVFESPAVALATFRPPPGMVFIKGHNSVHKQHLAGFTAKVQANGAAVWVHESRAGLLGLSIQSGNSTLSFSAGKSGAAYSGPPAGLTKALMSKANGKIQFSSTSMR